MNILKKLKLKNPALWQLVSYALLGLAASAVELIVFALCNYVLLTGLRGVNFSFWIFRYGPAGGGLCFFLSLSLSYCAAQVVNYFIQRKYTFQAGGGSAQKVMIYALMTAGIFILQILLPAILRPPLMKMMAAGAAELAIKLAAMFLGFAITFPINKYIVMPKG